MSRRHHVIPSQRLPLSVSTIQAEPRPQRSVLWTIGITVVGWILLAYPAVLLALLSYILIMGSADSPGTPGSAVAGVFGMAAVLFMVAAPPLAGFAVAKRRRGLWIGAVISWAVAIAAVVYVIVEWLVPLG